MRPLPLRPNMRRLETPAPGPLRAAPAARASGGGAPRLPRPCRNRCCQIEHAARASPSATPFVSIGYLQRPARLRQRGARRPAAAAVPGRHETGELRRGPAALRQAPLLRRVRVRLGLGRRLPAPRPRLLPEAAVRHPFHAGTGGRACWRRRTSSACCSLRCSRRSRQAGLSSAHVLFPRADRGRGWSRPASMRRRACSSTGATRGDYADFDEFLAAPEAPQAQEHPRRNGAACARPASDSRRLARRRDRRRTTGTSSTAATAIPTPRTAPRPT